MSMKGHDDKLCPFINETRFYEMRGHTETSMMMSQLNRTFIEWATNKLHELEFNE